MVQFLVVDTRSVERTIVRDQNMQICHSLRCKQIDMSTAYRLKSALRNNAGTPLSTFLSNAAKLEYDIRLRVILHLATTITSKLVFDFI